MSVQPTANEATLDGVFRHSPSGIKVLVVGAGPGGLLAAIECDIIALGPSAWSTLRFYPSMLEEYAQVIIDAQIVPCHQDGQQATSPFEFEFNREGVA
ncbi:FAD-dependent monooxygenase mdpD [Colletotrichum siamense]|nr:FAD-dependent monooxygenase mdpD [Colletotrichum siamense]